MRIVPDLDNSYQNNIIVFSIFQGFVYIYIPI